MKKKQLRLDYIKQLVTSHAIELQEELLAMLNEQGYAATQATLSRDLKELKIAKMPNGDGRYCYRMHAQPEIKGSKMHRVAIDGSVSIVFSNNIVVLHTAPGYASVIASKIDAADDLGILGTIAGDDTVMAVMAEGVKREIFVERLSLIIPNVVCVK